MDGQKLHLFFLLICFFMNLTHQQCLNTTAVKGSNTYFALAVVDNIVNPLGPQEACYYSCGAEIVTHPANKGSMAQLSLIDKAAPDLTASGFLENGKSYFVNQFSISDEEGGNGIGCLQVARRGDRLNNYRRTYKVCTRARVALCSFQGKQQIPTQTTQKWIQHPTLTPIQTPVQTSTSTSTPPKPSVDTKSAGNVSSKNLITTRHRRPKTTRGPKPTSLLTTPGFSTESISLATASSSAVSVSLTTTSSPALIGRPNSATKSNTTSSPTIRNPRHRGPHTQAPTSTSSVEPTPTLYKNLPSVSQVNFTSTISITDSLASTTETTSLTDIVKETEATIATTTTPASAKETSPPVNSDGTAADSDVLSQFNVDSLSYQVVTFHDSNVSDANLICQNKQKKMSDMSPAVYDVLSRKLKGEIDSDSKLVIGSWNNHSYMSSSNTCLILQIDHGIYPGHCSEAAAVLCQS